MSGFNLREIEFTNDGLRDSLTLVMSPELFHQNLLREIAAAKRSGWQLVLTSLTLRTDSFETAATFHEALIEIAFALTHGVRGEEFFARVSDNGFWLLLRSDSAAVPGILERLKLPHLEEISIASVVRDEMNYQEWIQRVDQIHFS